VILKAVFAKWKLNVGVSSTTQISHLGFSKISLLSNTVGINADHDGLRRNVRQR
jgi:hypothetical protein